MPIYEYHCGGCQRDCELLIRGGDEPVCPECGSRQLEKLVSRPAPPPQSPGIIARGRSQAAKEGHFSHYSAAEKRRI
jgi:putative FmdB family regulatory protein